MGLPITKTVTLVWDGAHWYDQETGILITGIQFPKGTADAERVDDTEAWTEDEIRMIVNQAIDARLAYAARMYFNADLDDDRLVTAAYVRSRIMQSDKITYDADQTLHTRINQLEEEVAQLSKPWWKR